MIHQSYWAGHQDGTLPWDKDERPMRWGWICSWKKCYLQNKEAISNNHCYTEIECKSKHGNKQLALSYPERLGNKTLMDQTRDDTIGPTLDIPNSCSWLGNVCQKEDMEKIPLQVEVMATTLPHENALSMSCQQGFLLAILQEPWNKTQKWSYCHLLYFWLLHCLKLFFLYLKYLGIYTHKQLSAYLMKTTQQNTNMPTMTAVTVLSSARLTSRPLHEQQRDIGCTSVATLLQQMSQGAHVLNIPFYAIALLTYFCVLQYF